MAQHDDAMFEAVNEIRKGVHEIKTSLFGVPGTEDVGFMGETKATLHDNGKRIRTLEKYRWMLVGIVALVVFAIEVAARVWK